MPWAFLEYPKLRAAAPGEISISPAVLLSNAVAAFALNLAVYLLIGKTSALTMNIAGAALPQLLNNALEYAMRAANASCVMRYASCTSDGCCLHQRSYAEDVICIAFTSVDVLPQAW